MYYFFYAYVVYRQWHPKVFNINKIHFVGNVLITSLSCFWKQIHNIILLRIPWFQISINKLDFSGLEIEVVTLYHLLIPLDHSVWFHPTPSTLTVGITWHWGRWDMLPIKTSMFWPHSPYNSITSKSFHFCYVFFLSI